MRRLGLRKEALYGYSFILPNFLGFLLLTLMPLVYSLYLCVHKWDGFNPPTYIGLHNFINIFHDEEFYNALKNTLFFSVVTVPLQAALALFSAVLIHRGLKGSGFFRTVLFFPNITTAVAISVIFASLFQRDFGPINQFLKSIGVANPPGWYASTHWSLISTMLVQIWKTFGYFMILYLAGLKGIPNDLYEAATVDGASRFRKFWHVTIPMLTPTTQFVLTMSVIWSLQVWDLVYVLTKGGPGASSQVLVMQIVNAAFTNNSFGYASALSWILFALTFIISIVQYRIQEKQVNATF